MIGSRGTLAALAGAGLVVAAVPTVVAANSSAVSEPSAVVLVAVGVLLVWSVGLAMWVRPADRRIARLLFLLAVAYSVRGLASSDNLWVYSLARALGQIAEFVLVWVMLAFPSGRLRSTGDRMIVISGAIATTSCGYPRSCSRPESRSRDRWSVSVLRTLAIAVFLLSAASLLSGLVLVFLFWAIPVSMLVGLLLGRLYTAKALERLVSGLERGPGPEELRSVLADVLDDSALEINYWVPDRRRWATSRGDLIEQPESGETGRVVTVTSRADGTPVAVLMHDEALLEEPALMEAVTASTRLALEANSVRTALALSDVRMASARDRARRELERDLHDGAQQRLIALRMKVSVLRRLLDRDVGRAASLATELGPDIDAALEEVRDLAHGRGVRRLHSVGLAGALEDLVERSPVNVTLETRSVGRYSEQVEAAVYFACAEALQNAAKHARPGGTVDVHICVAEEADTLSFRVADNGSGSVQGEPGEGLTNLRERVRSVGGRVDARPTAARDGFVVDGQVPVA